MTLPGKMALFAVAGVAGFFVDVAILYGLKDWAGPYFARVFSFSAAVLTTYLINRNFTFAGQSAETPLWHGFGAYFMAMLAGGLVNYGLFAGLVAWVGQVASQPVLGVAAGSVAGMSVNFILSDKWVFRPRSGSPRHGARR